MSLGTCTHDVLLFKVSFFVIYCLFHILVFFLLTKMLEKEQNLRDRARPIITVDKVSYHAVIWRLSFSLPLKIIYITSYLLVVYFDVILQWIRFAILNSAIDAR